MLNEIAGVIVVALKWVALAVCFVLFKVFFFWFDIVMNNGPELSIWSYQLAILLTGFTFSFPLVLVRRLFRSRRRLVLFKPNVITPQEAAERTNRK